MRVYISNLIILFMPWLFHLTKNSSNLWMTKPFIMELFEAPYPWANSLYTKDVCDILLFEHEQIRIEFKFFIILEMKFVFLSLLMTENHCFCDIASPLITWSALFEISQDWARYLRNKSFVGIILVSPHETITRPLGTSRGLKVCCIN